MTNFYEPAFLSSAEAVLWLSHSQGTDRKYSRFLGPVCRLQELPTYSRCPLGAPGCHAGTQLQVRQWPFSHPPNTSLVDVKRLSGFCSAGRLASRLSSTPHHLQQSMTLAFLENQLASALTLQSTQEYRYWLLIYARFLVNEGDERSLMLTHALTHLGA